MVYRYRITLAGIKGFFRVYAVNARNSLYTFHKQLCSDLEFQLDQPVLFKALDGDGAVIARYALVDIGYGTIDDITFADAGETRQDSTASGIDTVPMGFEYAAIHDGARPLITTGAIDNAIQVLLADRSLDGVVCGQPAIDTLKIVDGERIVETPPRSMYWAAQTPQIFSVEVMRRAHAAAVAEGFVGTDDASLVERMGGVVQCVASPRDNLKVTVPEDLRPVTAILLGRMSDAESAQDTGVMPRVQL